MKKDTQKLHGSYPRWWPNAEGYVPKLSGMQDQARLWKRH